MGGAFLTTASHGTDQLIVQRLLSSRSERPGQACAAGQRSDRALPVLAFCWWARCCMSSTGCFRRGWRLREAIRINPTFIVTQMPHGISGLLISGDSGGGHGEPERGAELALLDQHCRFLFSLESAEPAKNAGCIFPAWRRWAGQWCCLRWRLWSVRAARRFWRLAFHCLGGLRIAARSFHAGRAYAPGLRERRDGGNGLRICFESFSCGSSPWSRTPGMCRWVA